MKNLTILCLCVLFFFTLGFAAETMVLSGTSPTVISLGNYTVNSIAYPYPFPVPGAKRVWNQNFANSPNGETITFFSQFKISCACKTYTLYIAADDFFKAYVNGNFILSGSGWANYKSFVIPSSFLDIGANTLEIVGSNNFGPAFVIYAIVAA